VVRSRRRSRGNAKRREFGQPRGEILNSTSWGSLVRAQYRPSIERRYPRRFPRAATIWRAKFVPSALSRLRRTGLSTKEVATHMNRSAKTLLRVISGEREASARDLQLIAERCAVPAWFLLHGFDGAPMPSQLTQVADDVEAVKQHLGIVEARPDLSLASQ
jgi:transcriptional regulator with XRE-family HTH domain